MSDEEDDAFDQQVGDQIKSRRNELNLTQVELADEIGVSFQQLQKYETGENRVAVSRLRRIARALKVHPVRFFPDDGFVGEPSPFMTFLSTAVGRQLFHTLSNMTEQEQRIVLDIVKSIVAARSNSGE